MDLKGGYPFWSVKNGLLAAFPRLQGEHEVDALIIGGGITGALIARQLALSGLRIALVEKRDIAWGSTSASTALLQYEIDTEMRDLAEQYGEPDAAQAYLACAYSVGEVLKIAKSFPGVEGFPLESLYFASRFWHATRLRKEHAMRIKHGIEVSLLEGVELKRRFGLDAPVGLLSKVAGAVDPYQLTYAILSKLQKSGAAIHDKTEMTSFKNVKNGVSADFDNGAKVHCKHLVMACGYESQNFIEQRVADNRSSYAFVTDPQEGPLERLEDTMVWESARPYLYLRRTQDRRLLVGGEDDALDIAAKRDLLIPRKVKKMRDKLEKMYPQHNWQPAFAWAGTFAETKDGLPFFGPHQQHGPHVHFAMAYGGNGITYSQLGAEIFAATLNGKTHPLKKLFGFERLAR